MSNQSNKDNLDKLRHSTAHLLAKAVLDLYPEAKRTIGPSIDQGFYYDFDLGDTVISDKNFAQIEQRMHQLAKKWSEFRQVTKSKDEALTQYADNGYKKELIEELVAKGESLSFYEVGEPGQPEFYSDLCKGPHVDKPSEVLKHFKLLSTAGAYWRGDEKNPMLTRIYGTAFFSGQELDDYLKMLEEAKLRDHRKIGIELDLFTFSDLVGAGLPLWTPKGTILRNILDDYIWQLRKARGYQKVTIPHITKKDLFVTSGHWHKFGDDLFKITTREGHEFAMKPMNCPFHTQIYSHVPRSYKDLPQRYSETTMVYRDEQTGELHGLSRVRCITQDDAHVFCRESQLKEEFFAIWDIVDTFYKACGFPQLEVRLSLSDPDQMDKYLGSRADWDKAENQLRQFAKERGAEFVEQIGEAAFYGPKIDFMTKDSIGREWQVATIQVDRNMPKRFELNCISEDNQKEQVVMVHAAIMGAIERFIAILIEHHAGKFPFWMAPVQVLILPITDAQNDYARQVGQELEESGLRVEIDDRSERLQAKIRSAQLQKVPYMLIVGDKEVQSRSVAVRGGGTGDEGVMKVADLIKKLYEIVVNKA